MPTTQFLSFADSEVASIETMDDNIRILFSAAHILRHDPENSEESVEGYARSVELFLKGAKLKIAPKDFMGRISVGRTMIEGKWISRLPLPCTMTDHIAMKIEFANQSHFEIEAAGLECRFTGESKFFESMAC